MLIKLESTLSDYFNIEKVQELGLPSVQYISRIKYVSRLSKRLLHNLTEQRTQQQIHNHLIEKSQEILTIIKSSASKVAYQIGFEYPRSFSKLFEAKTSQSPLEFQANV